MPYSNLTERRRFLGTATVALSGAAVGSTFGSEVTATENEQAQEYVITPPAQSTIKVANSDALFPVRRVYCLGRNFRAHAIESGDDPDTSPPFFFMKPADAITAPENGFPYPTMTNHVSYEMEMVVALSSGGTNIKESDALSHVYGYGVGLDMTRRDVQAEAKERRRPWEGGKSFDYSAPCSPLIPAADIGHPDTGRIWLSVNGEMKQDSDINKMRWSVSKSIAILSEYFELGAGDVIFTGTPAGIGRVEKGDLIAGGVDGIDGLSVRVL